MRLKEFTNSVKAGAARLLKRREKRFLVRCAQEFLNKPLDKTKPINMTEDVMNVMVYLFKEKRLEAAVD